MNLFLKKYRYYLFVFVLILIVLLWLRGKNSNAAKLTSELIPYTVRRDTLRETITLTGSVDAEEKAILLFQSSGRLAWVGVKEGDTVKKYQTLASLDQRDVRKRLDKYLNTFLTARTTFDQTLDDNQKTSDTGISREVRDRAKRIIEQSENTMGNAVLDVELQHLALEYTSLTTPISGVVTRLDNPIPGVNISAATSQIHVVNPKSIYISVLADQTEVTQITAGEPVDLLFDAYPDDSVSGNVGEIAFSPKAGETDTLYEIKVTLPHENSDLKYRLGMTADATFTLKEKPNTLVIPQSYITKDKDKSYVTVMKNNKTEKQEIRIGEESDTQAEVASGLSEGDTIYAK